MIILLIKEFESNLGAYTSFIQELKNRQKNYGLKLIKVFIETKFGFCATTGILKYYLIEINFEIDIYCVMIFFVRV